MFGISRWRHRHLLAAWVTYWAALVGVRLGRAIVAILGVTGPRGHGSASGSFGDNGVTFTVINGTSTAWTGTSSFSMIALWVAGPPLVLWVIWMLSRPRHRADPAAVDTSSLRSAGTSRPLPSGQAPFDGVKRSEELHDRQPRD